MLYRMTYDWLLDPCNDRLKGQGQMLTLRFDLDLSKKNGLHGDCYMEHVSLHTSAKFRVNRSMIRCKGSLISKTNQIDMITNQ